MASRRRGRSNASPPPRGLPPPLWGRVGVGGRAVASELGCPRALTEKYGATPLPVPAPQGGRGCAQRTGKEQVPQTLQFLAPMPLESLARRQIRAASPTPASQPHVHDEEAFPCRGARRTCPARGRDRRARPPLSRRGRTDDFGRRIRRAASPLHRAGTGFSRARRRGLGQPQGRRAAVGEIRQSPPRRA